MYIYTLQVNSNFFVKNIGLSRSNGVIVTIKVINTPRLHFRYDDQRNVVLTDHSPDPDKDPSYHFELKPVNRREIHFVHEND